MKRFSLIEKLGLFFSACLLVGMAWSFSHAAVTPNSVVTAQSIAVYSGNLAAGDVSSPIVLEACETNGEFVYAVNVTPAATDREISLYSYNGTATSLICTVDITADASAPIVPVNLLTNVPLPLDANGNKVLYMPGGYSLYWSAENVAVVNPVMVIKQGL